MASPPPPTPPFKGHSLNNELLSRQISEQYNRMVAEADIGILSIDEILRKTNVLIFSLKSQVRIKSCFLQAVKYVTPSILQEQRERGWLTDADRVLGQTEVDAVNELTKTVNGFADRVRHLEARCADIGRHDTANQTKINLYMLFMKDVMKISASVEEQLGSIPSDISGILGVRTGAGGGGPNFGKAQGHQGDAGSVETVENKNEGSTAKGDGSEPPSSANGAHEADTDAKSTRTVRSRRDGDEDSDDAPVDPNERLLKAAEENDAAEVAKLIAAGADINHCGEKGIPSLTYACMGGHDAVVRELLKHKHLDINFQGRAGSTALLHAVNSSHITIVEELLKRDDVDLNIQSNSNFAALHLALDNHVAVALLLIADKRTDVNLPDKDGDTALLYVSRKPAQRVFDALVARGDVLYNVRNKSNHTPLMYASYNGNEHMVRYMLQEDKCDVNMQDKKGYTALILACRQNHQATAVAFVESTRVDFNIQTEEGFTALMVACVNGLEDVVRELVKLPPDRHDINISDKDGDSALFFAVRTGTTDILKLLLGHPKIQVNLQNKKGFSALTVATFRRNIGALEVLLGHSAVNPNSKDSDFDTPFHVACSKGFSDVVQLFLSAPGVRYDMTNKSGSTPLMLAIMNKKTETVKMLLDANVELNIDAQDRDGDTALHCAVFAKNENVVRMVIEQGRPSIDIENKKKTPPFIAAIATERVEVVRSFLELTDCCNRPDRNGVTGLMVAAMNDLDEMIDALLSDTEIDVNIRDRKGVTALMHAVWQGSEGALVRLLAHPRTKVNVQDEDGDSALLLACQKKNTAVVKALLNHPEINFSLKNKKGSTARGLAMDQYEAAKTELQKSEAVFQLIEAYNHPAMMPMD